MLQLDLVGFLEADTLTLNTTRLAAVLREYHVGSILNSPFGLGPSHGKDGWTAGEWKSLIRQIHETAQEVGAIPPIYGIDRCVLSLELREGGREMEGRMRERHASFYLSLCLMLNGGQRGENLDFW